MLQDHLSHLQEKKVILTVDNAEIVGTLEDLGYTMPIGNYVDEAMEVGRSII